MKDQIESQMNIIIKLLKIGMVLFTLVEAYPMNYFESLFSCCTKDTWVTTVNNKMSENIPNHDDGNIQDIENSKEPIKRLSGLRKKTLTNSLADSLQAIYYAIESAKDPENYSVDNACNRVSGFSEQLNICFPPNISDKKTRKLLHDIRHALTKMDYAFRNVCEQPSLIESLFIDLEYLRKLELSLDSDFIGKSPISVLELIESVSGLGKISAMQYKVDFKCEFSEGLESLYINNRLSVKRVLNNLLDNAILYTSGYENPTVFFEIKKSNGNYVEIAFKDNGVGMDSSILKKIGTLGYRADNTKTSGSGTGLYSSIELIESMGGENNN